MSRRRKKKKQEEEHMSESWLIPYADILTLLLALFVILFAMSSVNAQKFSVLSRAFNEMFTGGTGILQFDTPVPSGNTGGPNVQKSDQKKDQMPQKGTTKNQQQQNQNEQEKQDQAKQEDLLKLQSKLNSYISEDNLGSDLSTAITSEGLLVTIRNDILFNSGSADVQPQDLNTAREIAKLLTTDPPRNIIISGHTDNVPIKNARFASNWELSVMRAVNFMRIIMDYSQLDPKYFSAKGFGEYQPVAPNDTVEGRAKNRRVEILISPKLDQ
jgi:chemotaxis protein MotB